jgi:hypothetical protein
MISRAKFSNAVCDQRTCALIPRNLKRDALDVRPRLRQVHGAGIAQLAIMAVANVTGGA